MIHRHGRLDIPVGEECRRCGGLGLEPDIFAVVERIDEVMEQTGWSQRKVARMADVSPGYLAQFLNYTNPHFGKGIRRVCEVLGIRPDEMVER